MKADLIKIETTIPKIPKDWDYDKSLKIGKQLFIRWKDITREMAKHFYIAREMLRNPGKRTDLEPRAKTPEVKDWGDYCQEVSSIEDKENARRAFNRMLNNFFSLELPHVSYSSGESEWNTPPEYIESARIVMGSIGIDPASNKQANKIIKAQIFYTAEDDGLTKKWNGNVWMNPPYAQPLVKDFSNTLVKKYKNDEINQACVLVNNATETEFFQNMLSVCEAICFIKGRIKFIDKEGNPSGAPLQGQSILYFGNNLKDFTKEFKKFGIIMRRYDRKR